MPASERSLRITDAYRGRLLTLSDRLAAYSARQWRTITVEQLDATHAFWLTVTVAALAQAQRAATALTAAYVASFIASETGRHVVELPPIDPGSVIGASDGQPLEVPLAKTLIAVKASLKDGQPAAAALVAEQHHVTRLVTSAVTAAPRRALAAQIATHPQIVGWRRVTRGGCGACLALATGVHGHDEPLRAHDHCRCTAEPVIRGAADTVRRPTGPEIFWAMSPDEQDQALGPAAAQAVRAGAVTWPELVAVSPMTVGPDAITQAPLSAAL